MYLFIYIFIDLYGYVPCRGPYKNQSVDFNSTIKFNLRQAPHVCVPCNDALYIVLVCRIDLNGRSESKRRIY